MKISQDEKKYTLSGGAECIVVRFKNNPVYFALVHMAIHMAYPEKGSVATNSSRTEYIYVDSGSGTFTVNNEEYVLKKGDSILIEDGDTYSISAGKNGLKSVVLVTDGNNAESVITQFQE